MCNKRINHLDYKSTTKFFFMQIICNYNKKNHKNGQIKPFISIHIAFILTNENNNISLHQIW